MRPSQIQRSCRWKLKRGYYRILRYRLHRKHCEKWWSCSFWAISPFSTMFFPKAFFFSVLKWVYMEERVKPVFGKQWWCQSRASDDFHNPFPKDKFLAWSKLKAFADDKLNVVKMTISLFERSENNVGEGENASYQHFLIVLQFFQKPSSLGVVKSLDCVVKS